MAHNILISLGTFIQFATKHVFKSNIATENNLGAKN